jgi:ferric-dicitrate binding protein FerR (iron transport regulator)
MKKLDNGNNHIENLIHAYLSGTISQNDKDNLFRWLVKDSENVTYFNQISDIWLSSSVFQDMQDFNADEAFNRVKAKIDFVNTKVTLPKTRGIRLTWLKTAAILIPIILISSLVTQFLSTHKTTYTETPFLFEVPYGSKATVFLPDGSKVVLNAGSKLTCNEGFGKTNRDINLVGEGYFNVAKNKKLPFLVHAGNLYVRALGTEFNVKAYPEDKNIEAILIHGSVQINKMESKGTDEKPVVLLPKQSLIYNKVSDHFQINIAVEKGSQAIEKPVPATTTSKIAVLKTKIDPVIYTTWKEPAWTIYRLDLSDLAVELERKYDVTIQFGSEALKKIKFTGTLPDISLEQVLAAIRLTSPIDFKIKGKQVELTEDKDLIPAYKQYYRNSEPN